MLQRHLLKNQRIIPQSYEYETAARMVADEYDDEGEKVGDMELQDL